MRKKPHRLGLAVYRLSKVFVRSEPDWLSSPLRSAVVSVATDVAEELKKHGNPEKPRLLNIAQGALE